MRAKWAQRMMAAMAIAGLMGAGQAADFVAGFDDCRDDALSEIPRPP